MGQEPRRWTSRVYRVSHSGTSAKTTTVTGRGAARWIGQEKERERAKVKREAKVQKEAKEAKVVVGKVKVEERVAKVARDSKMAKEVKVFSQNTRVKVSMDFECNSTLFQQGKGLTRF